MRRAQHERFILLIAWGWADGFSSAHAVLKQRGHGVPTLRMKHYALGDSVAASTTSSRANSVTGASQAWPVQTYAVTPPLLTRCRSLPGRSFASSVIGSR